MKYVARSASDNTEDWPFWMIWDGHQNVTAKIMRAMHFPCRSGGVMLPRDAAEFYANRANELCVKL